MSIESCPKETSEAYGVEEINEKLNQGWYIIDTRTRYVYNGDKISTSFVALMGKSSEGYEGMDRL